MVEEKEGANKPVGWMEHPFHLGENKEVFGVEL